MNFQHSYYGILQLYTFIFFFQNWVKIRQTIIECSQKTIYNSYYSVSEAKVEDTINWDKLTDIIIKDDNDAYNKAILKMKQVIAHERSAKVSGFWLHFWL